MKKTIYILIATLIAVFAALSVLGSGGEYEAERLFYRAMKTNSKIVANPDVAPPKLLASVESDLIRLLKKYSKTDAAKKASITLAEFYVSHKEYDKALTRIAAVISAYPKERSILSTAYFLKGVVYEKQNRWDKALKEFKTLQDDYPTTQLGIQIPLYIGRYYRQKERDAEADQAYGDAVRFYEKMEKENSGKALGYVASTLLLQAYLNLKNYGGAGRVAEETLNKYPSVMTYLQILPYVDLIFIEKLNQREKAISIYKSAKDKVRDERLKKALEKKIAKLEAKK